MAKVEFHVDYFGATQPDRFRVTLEMSIGQVLRGLNEQFVLDAVVRRMTDHMAVEIEKMIFKGELDKVVKEEVKKIVREKLEETLDDKLSEFFGD